MTCAQLAMRLIARGILVSTDNRWINWQQHTETWLWDNYQGRFVAPSDPDQPIFIEFEDPRQATAFVLKYMH